MAIQTIDGFEIKAPVSIDNRYGPFSDVNEANIAIESFYRYIGLTVLITGSGTQIEYWYNPTIADEDLVPKGAVASFSGTDTQVVFYSGSTQISGSDNFKYIYASQSLQHGYQTEASGLYSHAAGNGSLAKGLYSYAGGTYTIASGSSQTVIGQYNVFNASQSAFIIGDGYFDGFNTIRHNVLFVSKSHFEVSASNTFLQGLSNASQSNVLTYNPITGQVYYTSSTNITGTSIPVDIKDEGNPVISNPAVLNFTGSGVSASANGTTVNIYIPGGGTPTPGGSDTQIQFNSGSTFSGSTNFTFNYTNNTVYLTGSSLTSGSITLTGSMFVSGAISASYGLNTVGFYGTASWALNALTASFVTASNVWGPFGSSSVYSASYASGSTSASYAETASSILNPYPINVTGSTLYSVYPKAYYPNPNPSNAVNSIFFGDKAGYNSSAGGSKLNNVIALGAEAGQNNNGGNNSYSNFIGTNAGDSSPFASQSNFIGLQAGYAAFYAYNSNFIGIGAGQWQTYTDEFYNPAPNSGSYSNYIGYGAGTGYLDTSLGINRSPGRNNTIIGTSISLPNNTSNYVNLGGAFFISGTYFNDSPLTPYLGYSSNILTESINNAKVGINLWNPSYSLHVSGTVAFPNLTNQSQVNVVVIDTASGQLFYTASSAIGGGGSGTPTPPATPLNSIQFNSASAFGGSAALTFISSSSEVYLTGSLITSGSTQIIGTANINGIALIGTGSAQALYTTARIITISGSNNIYSLQTASYDGAFFDYTLLSGTNARAGQLMSIWSGSNIRYTETTTTDIGSTSDFIFSVALTAGSASLQCSTSTAGAIIKTIIKSI